MAAGYVDVQYICLQVCYVEGFFMFPGLKITAHEVLTNFMGGDFISRSLRTRGDNFSEIEDEK